MVRAKNLHLCSFLLSVHQMAHEEQSGLNSVRQSFGTRIEDSIRSYCITHFSGKPNIYKAIARDREIHQRLPKTQGARTGLKP